MSSVEISKLRKVLSDNGYSLTKARTETFKLLLNPDPQSMNELLTKAAGKLDRVSVYRNIDVFEKICIVQRIYIGWKYKLELSDQFIGHHHHFSCLNCGRTIDIEDNVVIEDFVSSLSAKFKFTARRHQFEIDGYCKDCAE
ncbi:MAG: transcriptional repressor [Candidatus Saccharimonadales bacterium]